MNRLRRITPHLRPALLMAAAFGTLIGCAQTPNPAAMAATNPPSQAKTANLPVWMGGYQGQITSAQGALTPIALWLAPQGAFRLIQGGWGSGLTQIFTGQAQWVSATELSLIGAPESLAHWQFDQAANPMQLTAPDHTKTLTQTPALTGALALADQWTLTELAGTPLDANQKPPHLSFSLTQQVAGFDGCNRLMGRYTLEGDNGLHFNPLAGTLMACQGSTIDTPFRHMLTQVAKATIDGETLSLHNAAGQVIAQFRAVSSQALPSTSRKNSASLPE
jgi:heat shock protein HslJ